MKEGCRTGAGPGGGDRRWSVKCRGHTQDEQLGGLWLLPDWPTLPVCLGENDQLMSSGSECVRRTRGHSTE